MPFVTGGVAARQVGARAWELLEPVVYQGDRQRFTVPAGFRTDFASVPRVFVWLLPRYGVFTRAAILHDHLVRSGVVGRSDADGLFRRAMRELGVSFVRRWMMWAAVRLSSGLEGADAAEAARVAVVAVPSVLFLALPAIVLQVWLVLFWLVELAVWGVRRLLGRREPRPTMEMRT